MSSFREQKITPNTPWTQLDRIEINGVTSHIADITSVATRIFQYANYEDARDDANGTEVGTVITTAAASCMYDTLQLDGMWNNRDRIGYNCRVTIPKARFLNGGKFYRIENVVTPASGETFNLVPWILDARTSAID